MENHLSPPGDFGRYLATHMAASAWKLKELTATLSFGVPLPWEPTGDPPWAQSFDDEYRRITAANCIARDFCNQSSALDALREYATSGDNPEVRCRCVTLLGQMGAIDELVNRLVADPEPELRLYALEYILVDQPSRFTELESVFQDDEDWQIKETLDCFRNGKDIPLFQYEMPNNKRVNRSGESGRT